MTTTTFSGLHRTLAVALVLVATTASAKYKQIELEQEPLEKNKLTQKLEQTEKDLETAKKNLETFMGHVDSALSKYTHLSLPGSADEGAADAGGEAPAGE